MRNQLQEFMFGRSRIEFENLTNLIGEKIKINYVKDGISHNAMGTLSRVLPFKEIEYSGGVLPFVSRERIIRQICNEKGEAFYDRTDLIPSQIKIDNGNLQKYKVAILGSASGTKNEYVDNLRQDL